MELFLNRKTTAAEALQARLVTLCTHGTAIIAGEWPIPDNGAIEVLRGRDPSLV